MKKSTLASLALLATIATPAMAADDSLSFNLSVVSDYRYRGISQTRLKPALQGGVDYVSPVGIYAGAWGSTISWIKDNDVKGPVEVDIYGGYRGEIQRDLGYDVGLIQYAYVGNKLADTGGGGVYKNANTTELYGALTYGPVTAKLSYALTDLFGNYNFASGQSTKGSLYAELNGSFDITSGFTLAPHVGYQKVAHIGNASYTDYSVTVSKDLGSGLSVGLALVGTDADKSFYVPGAAANSSKFLGKTALVLSVKATF
ncbi:MAG: hypothetical protein IH627_00530 [Rubrivivax sp.]|nr:hypothetical protein [Rubrivivax sp.]